MKRCVTGILLCVLAYPALSQPSGKKTTFKLAGTWLLKAAEVILADGTRTTDSAYGTNAKGVLMIDENGQYSLQIFKPDRPKFVSGDKRKASPAEYASALLGISTHVGYIAMDTVNKTLQFHIDYAAYPNWDHTVQTRKYTITGDELYYEVPSTTAGGTTPVSIWQRIQHK